MPLGWNEFQASVKGQGLSREEVHEAYHTQARHGGGGWTRPSPGTRAEGAAGTGAAAARASSSVTSSSA